MKLRPCIDIHNGTVKQIIGSSLTDSGDKAVENFKAIKSASYYASLFKENNLNGGHVIILNSKDSGFYEASKNEALSALREYQDGFAVGGGINSENANEFIENGASHVIVTSYLFDDGIFSDYRLRSISDAVGPEHLIIDLSCKKSSDGNYHVYIDRWQKETSLIVSLSLFEKLYAYCDEFLIHGIGVEGKQQGFDEELVELLGNAAPFSRPITYAGGIASFDDIKKINDLSNGKVDVTIGSALSIYGGKMDFDETVRLFQSLS